MRFAVYLVLVCFYVYGVLSLRLPKASLPKRNVPLFPLVASKNVHLKTFHHDRTNKNTQLFLTQQELEAVGDEISILPSETGVSRVVMKFGGSSLATAERIVYVTKLIKRHVEQGYKPIIVCSAMGKTTNTLLSAGDFALTDGQINVESLRTLHVSVANTLGLGNSTINQLNNLLDDLERLLEGVKYIGELSPRTKDVLVSFGERCAIRIVAATLNKFGVPAQSFDSWVLGLRTSSNFGNAEVLDESYDNIKKTLGRLDSSIVPVVTGFLGHDSLGRITTLGRGGSDLSATVIGAAAGVDEVQVWKDVDGIMTSDPRLVKSAKPVTDVTYEEAAELAYFGAEVMIITQFLPSYYFPKLLFITMISIFL